MRVIIVHDSKFGNGKKIAEILGSAFESDGVTIRHIRDFSPEQVVRDQPDVLIVGSAVRMFMLSNRSRWWLRRLRGLLKQSGQHIPYAACFMTHMRPVDKIESRAETLYRLLRRDNVIEHLYPECFLAQVEDIEGPLKPGVMDRFRTIGKELVKWSQVEKITT